MALRPWWVALLGVATISAIGVAVAGNGDVYVVNSTEKRIVVWQTPQ